ncbi:hypothetical protein [Bradyrhizobium aeschynomenes]|uniref:hypothetical protein n=1 Tax=Bradyrhizobium aeschynomenes TaxID=2734909 RepID=UPI001554C09C|nr:hypothetical protein [Bradyrhizobium aeschynomenes]NPV24479.1 hypothetical protein [Bradyrhizobium aeschynomenes]
MRTRRRIGQPGHLGPLFGAKDQCTVTVVPPNRRVPAELLGGIDGDEPARGVIMEQDREIAEKSGRPPLQIKSLERVGAKKK